jgi:hypothetical protein
MTAAPRRIFDRVVDPSYLENLQEMGIAELRQKKSECEALEAEISYARRLIQGRLDILRHGAERMAGGGKLGVSKMVEDLPGILSEGVGGSASRLPKILEPANADRQRRDVERLASTADLTRLEELSPDELRQMVERLETAEKETSLVRRRIQGVMDQITGELVRRFREGHEDPTALLSS